MNIRLFSAQSQFYRLAQRQGQFDDFRVYTRTNKINAGFSPAHVGACAIVPIIDCGNRCFDFHNTHQDALKAFVMEVYGKDGESVVDLIAWPLDRPRHVMTMFAECGLIGLWEAMRSANYVFDFPLPMYRTPLDWLKSGCRGAAVVTPHIAARQLLDIPGRVSARDVRHGRELQALMQSVIPKDRVVIPVGIGRAAA